MLTHRLGYYLNFQLDHLNLMDAIYYFYIDTEQVAVDSLSSVVNCMQFGRVFAMVLFQGTQLTVLWVRMEHGTVSVKYFVIYNKYSILENRAK